ncbi:MAG: helix-turn-helix domain-containing protein [Pirellulales bacterium]|nr:helix-turn-helix domain-containing protein [Pirellulales bacterium]
MATTINTSPSADPMLDPLLDEKKSAQFLDVSPGTLSVWRCERRYPLPYVKIGRSVKYKLSDLKRFIESRTVGGEK